VLKLTAAAEHLQSYLDRADRPVSGTTYLALHDLIEKIDASHCLDAAVAPSLDSETNQQPTAAEPDECQLIFSRTVNIPNQFNFWLMIAVHCG